MNEIDEIKKEIARQMGVESFSQALEKEDWEKVDPEIRKHNKKYVASCIAKTFRSMDKAISPEILAKISAGDPTKPFLIIDES